jgi:hypothetical protein
MMERFQSWWLLNIAQLKVRLMSRTCTFAADGPYAAIRHRSLLNVVPHD